jgi:hypothetical protein
MKEKYNIRLFHYRDLILEAPKHDLNKLFTHSRMTEVEIKQLMDSRKWKNMDELNDLIPLKVTGPISLYYDFRVGDIIKTETIGSASEYHIVKDF